MTMIDYPPGVPQIDVRVHHNLSSQTGLTAYLYRIGE